MIEFYHMHFLNALQENLSDIQMNLIHRYQNDQFEFRTNQIHYIEQYSSQIVLIMLVQTIADIKTCI